MARATITCVMPARNAETTILAAVRSTLRALPADGILLVRDDGSTDETLARARSVRDSRLHVIEGDSIGIARSMNDLVARTETAFVARMDADDICLPWRFRVQRRAIASVDIHFSPWLHWRSGTPLVKPAMTRTLDGTVAALALLVENPFLNPSMFARTEALLQVGGCRDVASEDYDLWLRAAAFGLRLQRSGRPTVVYRRHTAQITQQGAWRERRAENSLVMHAWHDLTRTLIGVAPSWFSWRRAGFPFDGVPHSLAEDIARFRAVVAEAEGHGHAEVLRCLTAMEQRAMRAGRSMPGTTGG